MESTSPGAGRRRTVLAALLAFVAFAAAFTGVVVSGDENPEVTVAQIATLCASETECLSELFVEYMTANGLQAVSVIPGLAESTGVSCHQLSHRIGELAFVRFGEAVFGLDEQRCGLGFTHGWMVQYARDAAASTSDTAYAALTEYCRVSSLQSACMHGVGHALATIPVGSVEAEAVCRTVAGAGRSIADRSGAATCVEGFVMENKIDVDWNATRFPSAVTEGLCSPIAEDLRSWCNSMAFRRWIEYDTQYRGERYDALAAECRRAAGVARAVCFTQLGESVVTMYDRVENPPFTQAEMTNRLCPDADTACVTAQVSMMVSLGAEAADVTAYCEALTPALRATCRITEYDVEAPEIK
jgi:hypothetical protein